MVKEPQPIHESSAEYSRAARKPHVHMVNERPIRTSDEAFAVVNEVELNDAENDDLS